jgi:hypothetical protein
MTMTIKDYFKEFEEKVVGIEENPKAMDIEEIRAVMDIADITGAFSFDETGTILKYRIFKYFRLIERFIKAQPLENQRDLWDTTINLLNASKAFNNEKKEEIRKELLVDCFKELENLNNTIHLQLHTQKTTTVKGNSEKANKPDTTVKGNSEKFEESEKKGTGKKGTGKKGTGKVKPFNWQGTQTQLVYLIEQLYEQGFLSPISQTEKHRLTAQHFTVKGKSLNHKNLAQARDNYLNNKGGKPKGGEKIEQTISDAKKQNP